MEICIGIVIGLLLGITARWIGKRIFRGGREQMAERVKIPPAPTVYCPKEGAKVPIWHCLGSLTQGRKTCPYLIKATVYGAEWAEVECKWEGG